jgi:LysR family hydrogen peroxide-inducible transcriptional activator
MTLTQLGYVVAVAQHRNFGLAANASYVTQPTLSAQLQKLEEELGVTIFDRSKHPIQPTTVGELVIAQARVVIAEAQKIIDLTTKEQNEISGPISIGVIPTLSPYILPLFIQKFSDAYPQAQITVEEWQTHQIIDRLQKDQLSLGLLVTPLHIATLVEHPIFYEPFVLYISPEHPLARAKSIREKDLSINDVWLLTEGHCFRDQVLSICKDRASSGRSSESGQKNLRFESGNLETLKKMVDRSSGYTLLPQLAALDLQESVRKRQVREFQSPAPTREVSLVHTKLLKKRATVEALLSLIRDSIPNDLLKPKGGRYHRVDLPTFSK